MTNYEYDPEIQGVIDRFIAGEILTKEEKAAQRKKDTVIKNRAPNESRDWHEDHESAVKHVKGKPQREGNYYERLENRGINRTGGSGCGSTAEN
jgi:hypothetical protein